MRRGGSTVTFHDEATKHSSSWYNNKLDRKCKAIVVNKPETENKPPDKPRKQGVHIK